MRAWGRGLPATAETLSQRKGDTAAAVQKGTQSFLLESLDQKALFNSQGTGGAVRARRQRCSRGAPTFPKGFPPLLKGVEKPSRHGETGFQRSTATAGTGRAACEQVSPD
jgi:hypothetical protein